MRKGVSGSHSPARHSLSSAASRRGAWLRLRAEKPCSLTFYFDLQGVPGEAGAPWLVGPRVSVLLAIPKWPLRVVLACLFQQNRSPGSCSAPLPPPSSSARTSLLLPGSPSFRPPPDCSVVLRSRVNEVSLGERGPLVPRASRGPAASSALLAPMVPK